MPVVMSRQMSLRMHNNHDNLLGIELDLSGYQCMSNMFYSAKLSTTAILHRQLLSVHTILGRRYINDSPGILIG
jgi:hypothetical protein